MKNPKLPTLPARVFKRSHIEDPSTWTYKRNLEQSRAILGLLKEKIVGTCYEKAEPDQLVFYVKGTGDLLGNEIQSLTEVRDSNQDIDFKKDGNVITAKTDGKTYISDFESWRQVREPKVDQDPAGSEEA